MSGLSAAVVKLNSRALDKGRSSAAASVLDLPVQDDGLTRLRGHDHCLLVTYKRDGTPMPTPVWFGIDDDRLVIWTQADAFKAKRLRHNPEALVAPCSSRGKPLGPPARFTGHVIETDDAAGQTWGHGVIRRPIPPAQVRCAARTSARHAR